MIDLFQVVNDSPFALFACDLEGNIIFYNQAIVPLWGGAPAANSSIWNMQVKLFYSDGHPMPVEFSPIALTLRDGESRQNQELTIQRPDGTLRNLSIYTRAITDSEGKRSGVHCTMLDTTGYHEQDTRNAILSAIVESSDDAIISKDLNGIIKSWNQGAQRIFGYTEEEAVGKSITILIPESRLNEETEIIGNISRGNKIDHFHTIRLHKDGREIHISLTVSPIRNRAGKIIGASKVARDITGQVRSQELILKHTSNLEVLNAIGKGINEKMDVQVILQRVTDATTRITGAAFGAFFYNTVNEAGESYMLYTLSGVPRSAFEQFDMPRNTAVFQPTFAGKGIVRVDDITKDPRYGHNAPHFGMPKGHLPVVSYLSVPVISTNGRVIGGLFFGHPEPGVFSADHEDIISNIAAQAAIAIDNSMLFEEVKSLSAKKDEFIALASHELKTPLTSVKGYLQVLARSQHNEMELRFLNKSLNQIEKLNGLVEDMLNMSKIEAGKLSFQHEVFDLREVLLDVIDTFRHTDTSHEIIQEIQGMPLLVNADRQRIEQALINLIGNAIKYSPKANQIEVYLKAEGGKAIFRVRDFGIGLTAEQQKNVFSRFYRAEGTGGISGLGLGLYLTKQIIDRHQGILELSSEFGKGSTFQFSLPQV